MTAPRRRRVGAVLVAAAALAAVPVVVAVTSHPPRPSAAAAPLAGIVVAAEQPAPDPFDRDSLFGDWARRGGCTTRDRVLTAQLEDVIHVAGSTCKVLSGTLHDPYTGRVVHYRADRPAVVQVDHRVPVKEACQSGACGPGWDNKKRRAFANDLGNLVAVTGSVNEAKGDGDPAEWLPSIGRVGYAQGYLATKKQWGLTVDPAEAAALRSLLG